MKKNKPYFILLLILLTTNKPSICQEKNFIDIVYEGISEYRVDTVLFSAISTMKRIDHCSLPFLDLNYNNVKIYKHDSGILRYDYALNIPKNISYVFYTKEIDSLIYAIIGITEDSMELFKDRFAGYFNGLIVYNKKDSMCYYAGFCTSTPMLFFIDKKPNGFYEFLDDTPVINRIFLLDKKLNPVNRINIEKDAIISYSYIKKTDNGYREKIHACLDGKSLHEATLKKMYYFIQGGACSEYNLTFTVEPMYNRTLEKYGIIDFNHPGYK